MGMIGAWLSWRREAVLQGRERVSVERQADSQQVGGAGKSRPRGSRPVSMVAEVNCRVTQVETANSGEVRGLGGGCECSGVRVVMEGAKQYVVLGWHAQRTAHSCSAAQNSVANVVHDDC